MNRLRRTDTELSGVLGRDATDDELAKAMDMDIDKLRTYRRLGAEPLSLSAPVSADGEADLNDFLADEDCVAPLEEVVRSQSADELHEILTTLSAREQRILELRFGFASGQEQTLEQIGIEFNLTRERIRQIEAKAIMKLRHSPLVAELARHSN